jgi:hypothetical protein
LCARATTLTGVSRPHGGCSGLFPENESSRLKSLRAFVVSGLIPQLTKKIPATDVRHRCDSKFQISPSAVCADDRSGLFPENESSLLENHAPVRCWRVNPATGAKEF